jgi:hypothetical protein
VGGGVQEDIMKGINTFLLILDPFTAPIAGLAEASRRAAEQRRFEEESRQRRAERDAFIEAYQPWVKFYFEQKAAEYQQRITERYTLSEDELADIEKTYLKKYETVVNAAASGASVSRANMIKEAQKRADALAAIEAAKRADVVGDAQQRLAIAQSQTAARNAATQQTINVIQSGARSMRNAAMTTAQIRAQEALTRQQTQRKSQEAEIARAAQLQQLQTNLSEKQRQQQAARMGANLFTSRRLPPVVSVTGVRS